MNANKGKQKGTPKRTRAPVHKWTPAEDAKLLSLMSQPGATPEGIALAMQLTTSQIKTRQRHFRVANDTKKVASSEDRKLLIYISMFKTHLYYTLTSFK